MEIIAQSQHAELKLQYRSNPDALSDKVRTPEDAYRLVKDLFDPDTISLREEMYLLLFNGSNRCTGWFRVSIGSKTATILDISQVVGVAILGNAHTILLSHNHPSGNPGYSDADLRLTKRILNALHLHGIELMDHLIIFQGGFTSIRSIIKLEPDLVL